MKRKTYKLLAAALLLAGSQQALATAVGTAANTTITNTVSVDYKVGGNAQTQTGNNVAFTVDRKIDLTVVSDGNTPVNPNTSGQVLTYTVTNNSNDTLDFALAVSNGGGDNFDPTSPSAFVESTGAGAGDGYQAGSDTGTFIDELASGDSIKVYVVAGIPGTATNGQTGALVLTATATDDSAVPLTNDAGANVVAGAAQNVFADLDATGGNTAKDGKALASASYTVSAASVSVVKTFTILSDPTGQANPKAIPGAVIEYCITVTNAAGGAAATNIKIADAIPSGSTYVPESIKIGTDCTYSGATAYDDDETDESNDDDPTGSALTSAVRASYYTGAVDAYHTGTMPAVFSEVKDLAANAATTTLFHVTIN